MENRINNSRTKILIPISVTISLILGFLIGKYIYNGKELFDKGNNNESFSKLEQIVQYVKMNYVDEISYDELEEKAINKFLESLDPHTKYLDPNEAKLSREELMGNFSGIGIQFNIFKDTICAVKIIPKGPAETAGMHAGDRIIKVNDSLVAGKKINSDSVMKLLKGKDGSKVKLLVYRKIDNKNYTFNITRGNITVESINAAYLINKNTAYVKIESFGKNTYLDFWQKLSLLKKDGAKNVIIDLRDNGGGYLDVAVNILDEFFEGGKLLVYTDGKTTGQTVYKTTNGKNSFVDMNVVVLINEMSASASEIIAGATQDNDRGIVIGRRSFGKGLVQNSVNFVDGSELRLTISRYYTPSGRCIQKKYNGNPDDYNSDIINRYLHGELYNADSITFKDTTKYFTTNGRVVYGGGGIMPDYFVPNDTSFYSTLYENIFEKNLCYIFGLQFIDDNRVSISKCKNVQELKRFINDHDVYNKFWKYVEDNEVEISNDDLLISKKYIENTLTAYIIRDLLSENDFYKIIYSDDKAIKKAIFEINNKNKLLKK